MAETRLGAFSVPPDHAIFPGHFPGRPLVPGVMLLDRVLRECARLLSLEPRALRIRECKFFAPLEPGQDAELVIESSGGRHKFRVRRAQQVLASGVLEMP